MIRGWDYVVIGVNNLTARVSIGDFDCNGFNILKGH